MPTGHPPRACLVHDWLTGMRGGEAVLEALCRLLGPVDLLTLIHVPGAVSPTIERRRIVTSFLNELPAVARYYRCLLPLMPLAARRLDASEYDLVISSSHCVAHGVGGRWPGQLHVCYCHTPMRYVWSHLDEYAAAAGPAGPLLRSLAGPLRRWDLAAAAGVDLYLANSQAVAGRIERYYGRQAVVVHPPVDVDFFTPDGGPREDFYLAVAGPAAYKRIEQAIAACRKLGCRLKVAGRTTRAVRALAGRADGDAGDGANVELPGWQSRNELRELYRRCRAVLFPGEEDFGIVPVEACACGAPVIALAAGGALETVVDAAQGLGVPRLRSLQPCLQCPDMEAPTGLLYRQPTTEGLAEAIRQFESLPQAAGDGPLFDAGRMHEHARRFAPEAFADGFLAAVGPLIQERGWLMPW